MSSKAVFLSNRPLGKDLLDGQSQDYVAQAIKKHKDLLALMEKYKRKNQYQ